MVQPPNSDKNWQTSVIHFRNKLALHLTVYDQQQKTPIRAGR